MDEAAGGEAMILGGQRSFKPSGLIPCYLCGRGVLLFIPLLSQCLLSLLFCPGLVDAQTGSGVANELLVRQDPDYVNVDWEVQDGLPSARINDVIQSHDGYIWVATLNGLARFDGVRFERFYQAETPGLASSMISCLLEDSREQIWYGTQSGEVGWMDDQGFHLISFSAENLLDRVNRMVETSDGTVWAASRKRLLAIQNHRPGKIIARPEQKDIWDICAAEGGGLWVLFDGGNLYLLNTKTGKMSCVLPGLPGQWRNIARARSGGLWVRDGQCLRRWQDGRWVEDRGVLDLQSRENTCLCETRSGKLTVGTYGQGVWMIDEEGRQHKMDFFGGLSHDQVLSLCEDQEGDLWVGTVHGLNRVTRRVVRLVAPPDNWQNRAVTTIAPAMKGGLWVGTEGAGLYRIGADGQVQFHQCNDLWRQDYIRSVLEDTRHQVWSGLFYFGLWLRDSASPLGYELPEATEGAINAMFEDSNQQIWIGSTKGVIRYDEESVLANQKLLSTSDIRCFAEAGDHSVWIGSQDGKLYQFKLGKVHAVASPLEWLRSGIHSLHFDSKGTLWIGTWRNGLVFDRNGRWGELKQEQGLPDDFISNIQSDKNGNLWIGSSSGIFRISHRQLDEFTQGRIKNVNCLQLGIGDGLGACEILGGYQPTTCRTDNGSLWYVTSLGLVTFDPDAILPNNLPPPVVIESIFADGRLLPPATTVLSNSENHPRFFCPAGTRQVAVHFTALSLSSPQQIRFRYRLTGLDNRWMEAADNRVAEFSLLPPGKYVFEVTACNNQGVWNPKIYQLSFEVLPLFWQTVWFRLAVALFFLVLVSLVYRARALRLLALERLRQQIARDLHDEVGANLGSISLLAEVMERKPQPNDLAQIRSMADQTVDTLRDLVWIINPSHERLSDMIERLRQISAIMMSGMDCRFEVKEPLNDVKISLKLRRNVPPLLKEILHNVLKHSRARQVEVRVWCEEGCFHMMVSDDGLGFDMAKALPGNGIKNYQIRAHEMSGSVKVRSKPGSGTIIELAAPITKSRDWQNLFKMA